MREMVLPPPSSLSGTYEGTCLVCFQGTDTGVAFRGSAEWLIAGLVTLGIPSDEATTMVCSFFGCKRGMVPMGRVDLSVRVCDRCATKAKANIKVGLIAFGIPVLAEPDANVGD